MSRRGAVIAPPHRIKSPRRKRVTKLERRHTSPAALDQLAGAGRLDGNPGVGAGGDPMSDTYHLVESERSAAARDALLAKTAAAVALADAIVDPLSVDPTPLCEMYRAARAEAAAAREGLLS